MATKVTPTSEKFTNCEVKRRRLRSNGPGYEPFWKVKTVVDAIDDGDTELRCKDCHGPLKLVKRHTAAGTVAHVEHKDRADAAYCSGTAQFTEATDGRTARLSAKPVQ